MAVLWCGGEDIDFPNGSTVDVSTASGNLRAGYARCAIAASGSGAVMKSTAFSGGAVTSLWMASRLAWNNPGFAAQAIGPQLASAGKGLLIATDGAGVLTLYKFDSTGPSLTSIATESGASFTSAVLHRVDMQITGWGVSAAINVYLDNVLKIAFTGDVTFSGAVLNVDSIFGRTGNVAIYASEIIVADADTRTFSLVTLAPNAAGTTAQWTGAYTDVNEVTIDDASVVSTNAAALDEQFNLSELPAGSFIIRGVKEAARASITAAATATKVALGFNSGGVVDAGTSQALTTSWATYERLMQVNPITAVRFTAAEINALQVNLRSGA